MKLPPEEYKIESVFSVVLNQYVDVIKMDEDSTHTFVEDFPLHKITQRTYIEMIVITHLADPSVLKHISAGLYTEFLIEMYQILVLMNPCLQLGHIIKERKVSKEKEISAKDINPEEVYAIIKDYLYENVIGQKEAIDDVVKAVGKGLLRKESNRKRPIVAMLFAGLSGSGKTHVARMLALGLAKAGLTSEKDSLVKIDAGEYGEQHQLNRLTGAPLGYIGSDQDNLLQKKIKPKSIQVFLVDEVEKAHNKLYNFLLAVLEDGVATSGKNEEVDMTNTIVILTSNLGSAELSQELRGGLGFKIHDTFDKNQVVSKVRKSMPLEFFNRLSKVVIFSELTEDESRQVARLELDQLRERMDHLIQLQWDKEVEDALIHDLPRDLGLRQVRNRVDHVEGDIASMILTRQINKNCPVILGVKDKQVVIGQEND